MNKGILYVGLGVGSAALVYLGYKYFQTPSQNYRTTSLNPNSNQNPATFTVNDQQTYPFQANQPPRIDNSNQPWANNNRASIAQASNPSIDVNQSNFAMLANYAKAGAELTKGLTSIWDDLGVSSWFSEDDPAGFDATVDVADWDISESFDSNDFAWNV